MDIPVGVSKPLKIGSGHNSLERGADYHSNGKKEVFCGGKGADWKKSRCGERENDH